MHGAPCGTMTSWLQLEVEERAQRYGRPRRPTRRPSSPAVVRPAAEPAPQLAQDDVAACA